MNPQKELGLETPKPANTTAIYPNRVKDKNLVETMRGIREAGDESTVFLTPRDNPFAKGYCRVVYGDHGPYVEFDRRHITMAIAPRFPRRGPLPPHCYYEWMDPSDGSRMIVYFQTRDVKNLPNPPAGGFRGFRKEGYADYIPGKIYVSAFELTIQKP